MRPDIESAAAKAGATTAATVAATKGVELDPRVVAAETKKAGGIAEATEAARLRERTTPDAIAAEARRAKAVAEATEPSAIRVAAATGREAAGIRMETEQTQPLDEKAALWLDPKTGKPAEPAWYLREAKGKGYVPVTETGLNATATARAALTHIKEYRELAPRLLVEGTGSMAADLAKVQSNRLRIATLRKAGDPDVKRLDALFGAIATLARATGDTANIAVAERQMLREMVLTDGDTVQSAEAKLNQAERILRGVVGGRNVPLAGGAKPDDAQRPGESPDAWGHRIFGIKKR
jgi:hypothetical protein